MGEGPVSMFQLRLHTDQRQAVYEKIANIVHKDFLSDWAKIEDLTDLFEEMFLQAKNDGHL